VESCKKNGGGRRVLKYFMSGLVAVQPGATKLPEELLGGSTEVGDSKKFQHCAKGSAGHPVNANQGMSNTIFQTALILSAFHS